MIKTTLLIILDSVGIGELSDASKYGDEGSNTLANSALAVNGIELPNLAVLGLGNLGNFLGITPVNSPLGAYGKMAPASPGKDTTTGHWEIAGIILDRPFPVYPQGFPFEIIDNFEKIIGRKILGNKAASGTEIIKELGEDHVRTGMPIVYTSADSVFQIAAHEEVIPITLLYEMCIIARQLLKDDHAVGRVIARPFDGKPGSFKRTERRHDFSLIPPRTNILTLMSEAGYPVTAVGKINDIFAGTGISKSVHTINNTDGMKKTVDLIKSSQGGLIFTNLVEFDMLYGHRNDPFGYATALKNFDRQLPAIIEALGKDDLLIITADHGCDPTTASTDHSREFVPLLITGTPVQSGINLGIRETFADIAATLAEIYNLSINTGTSFANRILPFPLS